MKISGQQHYDHPRERVFQALLDAEVLSRTLPGCEDLQQTGDNEYAGALKMKVGPVQGVFQGKVQLLDLQPPEGYRLRIEGSGAPGFMNGDGAIRLEEADGGTDLHYDIDANVGGKIASIGQRLVESSAKVITRQGLTGLGVQLDRLAAESGEGAAEPSAGASTDDAGKASATSGAAAPEGPSQAAFARDFARGLADELLPSGARWPLLLGGALVVVVLVAVYLRACA